MTTTIITKNSSTAGAAPLAADLVQGELAVNVTDKALYTENASGTVVKLNAPSIVDNGNATAITIDSSENVGIGTSSPSSKLQVAGDVRINTGATATTGLPIYAKQTNNDQRGIWTESATTDSNGRFYCDNSVVGIAAAYSTTGSYLPITFTTSATERARIDSSGNLLVGTTNSDLPSFSTTNVDGVGLSANKYIVGSGSSRSCAALKRYTSTGQVVEFWYGTSQVGSISVTGSATSYVTTSDYRLKENVQPMTGALEKVAALKPVTYNWKSDGSATQGFIAHELQAVVPDCVTGEKDATRIEQYEISPAVPATYDEEGNELTPAVEAVMGEREVPSYQGIDTSFLVATLTAAIQEQQAIIDAQASVLISLTARIEALES